MARIFWICPLVQIRPQVFAPRMEIVRRANGMFPCRWKTTDALRAAPWAVGAAEVDSTQLAAVQADGQIRVFEEALGEWIQQFNQLSAARRSAINTFCTTIGVTRPANAEVLRDFCDRLVTVIEPTSIETLLAELLLP